MRPPVMICFAIFLVGVVLVLLQLWFKIWSPDDFSRLIITDGIFLLVGGLWVFLVKENKETSKITKNGLD